MQRAIANEILDYIAAQARGDASTTVRLQARGDYPISLT